MKNGALFYNALSIAFVTLKLTGVIDWSWVWVLAPVWLGLSVVLLIGLLALVLKFGRR